MNPCSVSWTPVMVDVVHVLLHHVSMFFVLRYLGVVHDEAACLSLPLHVVHRLAAERQRTGLCGSIRNLSITQTAARYEQSGVVRRQGGRHGYGLAVARFPFMSGQI